MPPRKLTPGEISATVEKIRKRYDDYITQYFKPKRLRRAFEARYDDALRSRVDVSSFLLAEISAIEELIAREEARIQAEPPEPEKPPAPSFADKVLEENRKRISPYPDVPFHADASEEVRRLVGALSDLERDHWPELSVALRNTMYAMTSAEMLELDSQLRSLSTSKPDEPPAFLTRLMGQLRAFPRNYPMIEREEKEYILEAAFFLNDLVAALERVQKVYTEMPEQEKKTVGTVSDYVQRVVGDFRLKEFRRRQRWERQES